MSWEAFRWTAKSPSELYQVLGPHGVDELIRQARDVCWRELPAEGRTLAAAVKCARDVLDRNVAVWEKIKKPSPEAFFQDLLPHAADGFVRQAMVLCWMMMPRTGGREVPEALRIVRDIFDRNMQAWEEDEGTFTGKAKKSKKAKAADPGSAKVKAGAKAKAPPKARAGKGEKKTTGKKAAGKR